MLLPITKYKKNIIEAVRDNYVTIISAETGSGKSTQIPQYLSYYYDHIIVTEPRIMAAKTLAKRVAEEMCVTLGEEVGYKTAYDKCCIPTSKILYCTDGLQLIRTIFNEDNESENVLIIDEVHEWNLNIETLIAWCKFMHKKWNTKVVIMSATLDTKALADFFGMDVAVLNIPGSLYEVTLEERPKNALISTIKENIEDDKNILVFVAGKKEIQSVIEKLEQEHATVLPLHGEMDWDDQKKCFGNYPNPKVIVATNVAQTSITIPDIDVVVDSGEARISIAKNGIQGLFLEDISRSDITQRAGRAGRTKSGKYFLCSETPIKYRNENAIPEIQRSILDRVVLQLATIGLNAEELQFFHQPEIKKILIAKKELTAIGAMTDNKVTELGYKIVKIPVSVQFARMIVEAEKYGVTEQVMTIAAIIEMGGLLAKESSYRYFTTEHDSDLLAELDVWNYLNRTDYIDFKKLGIKKKSFFKIKEHIQKLKETLYGIVDITNNDDREAIVKSCLYGLVSNIYVNDYNNKYYGEDSPEVYLDKNSCMKVIPQLIVGIPQTIEFKNKFGWTNSMNIVKFASRIDVNTLYELVPDKIVERTDLRYSKSMDAVEITVKKIFAGYIVDSDVTYDSTHPRYDELKAEYEREIGYNKKSIDDEQKVITIDDKQFNVHNDYFCNKAYIIIDHKTLFTTEVKEVTLDSGRKVYFCSDELIGRRETNIVALRNAVEMNRIKKLYERYRKQYDSVNVSNIYDVITNSDKIGKIKLTMNNGGFGNMPIFAYGYIFLKKNTVKFNLGDNEEIAKTNTLEALQYLFYKEIEKNYGANRFSHQEGKKKKSLSESEMEAKKDFDSLVREMLNGLTIENVLENLEFLEEYYQELMG